MPSNDVYKVVTSYVKEKICFIESFESIAHTQRHSTSTKTDIKLWPQAWLWWFYCTGMESLLSSCSVLLPPPLLALSWMNRLTLVGNIWRRSSTLLFLLFFFHLTIFGWNSGMQRGSSGGLHLKLWDNGFAQSESKNVDLVLSI